MQESCQPCYFLRDKDHTSIMLFLWSLSHFFILLFCGPYHALASHAKIVPTIHHARIVPFYFMAEVWSLSRSKPGSIPCSNLNHTSPYIPEYSLRQVPCVLPSASSIPHTINHVCYPYHKSTNAATSSGILSVGTQKMSRSSGTEP